MISIGSLYGEQGKGPANSCPILSRTPFIMVGMTDKLRVILEIGKKRKIAAAAVDWPGLDRWGTSEEGAQEKLASYIPRYADVAKRAGVSSALVIYYFGTRDRLLVDALSDEPVELTLVLDEQAKEYR